MKRITCNCGKCIVPVQSWHGYYCPKCGLWLPLNLLKG